MIAVDTNVLVHAHRAESPFHDAARDVMRGLAEGSPAWGIPWPCVHEFYAKVTHSKIFRPPSTREQAIRQLDAWLASPTVSLLGEGVDHWERLSELVRRGRVEGPMVHDARVAAICLSHGVAELLSADRDFGRFPDLVARNPLIRR